MGAADPPGLAAWLLSARKCAPAKPLFLRFIPLKVEPLTLILLLPKTIFKITLLKRGGSQACSAAHYIVGLRLRRCMVRVFAFLMPLVLLDKEFLK